MCVKTCNLEEWLDTATGKCKYCSAAGGLMYYCTECNSTNSC